MANVEPTLYAILVRAALEFGGYPIRLSEVGRILPAAEN
jgi:hypothetical protein